MKTRTVELNLRSELKTYIRGKCTRRPNIIITILGLNPRSQSQSAELWTPWSMEIEATFYAHVYHIYLFLARQYLCEALRAQNTNTNSPILTILTNLPIKGDVYTLRRRISRLLGASYDVCIFCYLILKVTGLYCNTGCMKYEY